MSTHGTNLNNNTLGNKMNLYEQIFDDAKTTLTEASSLKGIGANSTQISAFYKEMKSRRGQMPSANTKWTEFKSKSDARKAVQKNLKKFTNDETTIVGFSDNGDMMVSISTSDNVRLFTVTEDGSIEKQSFGKSGSPLSTFGSIKVFYLANNTENKGNGYSEPSIESVSHIKTHVKSIILPYLKGKIDTIKGEILLHITVDEYEQASLKLKKILTSGDFLFTYLDKKDKLRLKDLTDFINSSGYNVDSKLYNAIEDKILAIVGDDDKSDPRIIRVAASKVLKDIKKSIDGYLK